MQPNNIQLIPSARARTLCGGISLSALERWIRRPELGFPKARMIGQRRFWVEAEILAWLESREVAV